MANYIQESQFGRFDIGAQYVLNHQFSIGTTFITNQVKPDSESPLLTSINLFIGFRCKPSCYEIRCLFLEIGVNGKIKLTDKYFFKCGNVILFIE